jgi:SH3-like domain-containing protein
MRAIAALRAACAVLAFAAAPARAIEFRAVAEPAVILYDAPSARSSKLFVVNKGYPLEVVVTVEGWVKVRDANGSFAWADSKQLTERRTVMVRVPLAQIRDKPDDNAPVAYQAQQNVLLDLVDVAGSWVQVRHRDSGVGFVKAQQVWGA